MAVLYIYDLLTSNWGGKVYDIWFPFKRIVPQLFLAIIVRIGTFNRYNVFPVGYKATLLLVPAFWHTWRLDTAHLSLRLRVLGKGGGELEGEGG